MSNAVASLKFPPSFNRRSRRTGDSRSDSEFRKIKYFSRALQPAALWRICQPWQWEVAYAFSKRPEID
jgi:hypothetical protein